VTASLKYGIIGIIKKEIEVKTNIMGKNAMGVLFLLQMEG